MKTLITSKIRKQYFFRINFCIAKQIFQQYFCNQQLQEKPIQDFHFFQCSNNNCKAIFPLKLDQAKNVNQQFCPECNIALTNSHIVQCENCQAIINFIPLFPNEEAVVYYVPKCTICSGTIKDEKRLSAQYFPKSFI